MNLLGHFVLCFENCVKCESVQFEERCTIVHYPAMLTCSVLLPTILWACKVCKDLKVPIGKAMQLYTSELIYNDSDDVQGIPRH